MRISAIMFDLGDTLLDFGAVDVPSLFEAGARLTYDYLRTLGQPLPKFSSYHRRQLWAIRWNYLKSRFTRREFNSMDLLGKLHVRMGHRLTREQTEELAWLWYEPLSRCATVEPGLRDMLLRFRGDGLKLGIISNTFVPGKVLDRHLASVNLLDLLPIRVYSCDVKFRKPDPRIFRIAIEKAGAEPSESLFVGDSPGADVAGSAKVGMIPVLKDPAGKHLNCPVQPKHRIKRLADLPGIVAEYNSRQA